MPSPLGIAYTSYAVRMLQGRDIMQSSAAALSAEVFVDLCGEAGASGCQIDLSQIGDRTSGALQGLRRMLDARDLWVELSIPAAALASREAFADVVAVAQALGATRLRVALLMGRRYESFPTLDAWQAFAAQWLPTLRQIAPAAEQAGLVIGIENHKDFLAGELAGLLESLDSPALGACVDFGNNLALLETPEATIEALAPWAVTSHVKDMAVAATGDGFALSEVPLGSGLLPLARMVGGLRDRRSDVRFLLEMITRDPLPVPFRLEPYWATRQRPDRQGAEAFAASLLEPPRPAPLPHTTGLSRAEALALEDGHVRACLTYARDTLRL
jgi:sugar phosphate isomerase/epimerase